MRVISRRRLRECWVVYPDVRKQLEGWYRIARAAKWTNAEDVKAVAPNVSVLRNDRFVFNIKGNKYRLVIRVKFRWSMVYVRWVGSHSDYDEIDANTV